MPTFIFVVEDLKDLLRFIGHEELITPQNVTLMQFYMQGLATTLHFFNSAGASAKEAILQQDKTVFLPQEMYEALNDALIRTDADHNNLSRKMNKRVIFIAPSAKGFFRVSGFPLKNVCCETYSRF